MNEWYAGVTSPKSLVIYILISEWRDAGRDWAARDGAAVRLSAVIYGGVMLLININELVVSSPACCRPAWRSAWHAWRRGCVCICVRSQVESFMWCLSLVSRVITSIWRCSYLCDFAAGFSAAVVWVVVLLSLWQVNCLLHVSFSLEAGYITSSDWLHCTKVRVKLKIWLGYAVPLSAWSQHWISLFCCRTPMSMVSWHRFASLFLHSNGMTAVIVFVRIIAFCLRLHDRVWTCVKFCRAFSSLVLHLMSEYFGNK